MIPLNDFDALFNALTGNPPFPWQRAMYHDWFAQGKIPASCNLPTGLGKTSVVAIWLIALANHPLKMPRRLVYVVNRRTVVDQTTDEVLKYRKNIVGTALDEVLRKLCAIPLTPQASRNPSEQDESPLALSTLRGQFADNREWSADPARPAVICGTVDMIGSRLLFSGYGIGFKSKPLHAGFLGQDALLIHDEAHLEPAFQKLIDSIRHEQDRSKEFTRFHVMELTATSRSGGDAFELTPVEKSIPADLPPMPSDEEELKKAHPINHVHWRLTSKKAIHFKEVADEKKELMKEIIGLALKHKDDEKNPSVLIFVQTVQAVDEVVKGLKTGKVAEEDIETLTGTMRGKERDALVEKPTFQRFLKGKEKGARTAYLVCTSAGEVGVDMSADHLVCDLSTYESMAQRFGRVNRYGKGDARIDIVIPKTFDTKDKPREAAREKTLGLLTCLRLREDGMYDASPASLGELLERTIREGCDSSTNPNDREKALREYVLAAFAPMPTILPASDILFDAWALTTIKGKLPGRPPVEPYLHGLPTEWQPPETHVAWREEVERLTNELLGIYAPAALLDEYPLLPRELLREPSYRAFKHFESMAKRFDGHKVPVWLLDDDGSVKILTLAELADKDSKDRINGKTVILPPSAGGLEAGMLSGASLTADDVADTDQRQRLWNDYPKDTKEFRRVMTLELPSAEDDDEPDSWNWFVRIKDTDGGSTSNKRVLWQAHVADVERETAKIVDALPLPKDLRQVVKIAATYHDHGKRRTLFQHNLGNANPDNWWAKSDSKQGGRFPEKYRHEFGSLLDIERELESLNLGEHQDLVLHLIAAHHGRARPHFPAEDVFDPDYSQVDAERIASEVPRRFARLQRKYGRWGLAYLESLLRAGDWAASAQPTVEDVTEEKQP